MASKEIYPNAPLQLVAFEVKFPTIRRGLSDEGLDVFQKVLGEWFPIFDPVEGKGSSTGQGDLPQARWFQFLTKSRTTAVSVQPKRLVVETTNYSHYEDFRKFVALAVRALESADRVPVFERIGLRYIDEVRAPVKKGDPKEWTSFINDAFLQGCIALAPCQASHARVEGVLRFDLQPSHTVVVRYGNLDGEFVGEGGLRLKPNKVRSGPFFLIDIDSFVVGQAGKDEFSSDSSLAICDSLREPVREIFEKCITDRLRNEVLRKKITHEPNPEAKQPSHRG